MDWNFWPDQRLMDAVAHHRSGSLTSISRAVMWAGTSPAVLACVAAAVLVVMAVRRSYRPALAGGVAAVSAGLLVLLLKDLFDRPRPPVSLALVHAAGSSFPSDLAAVTAALATALFLSTVWTSKAHARSAGIVLAAGVIAAGLCMVSSGPIGRPTSLWDGRWVRRWVRSWPRLSGG